MDLSTISAKLRNWIVSKQFVFSQKLSIQTKLHLSPRWKSFEGNLNGVNYKDKGSKIKIRPDHVILPNLTKVLFVTPFLKKNSVAVAKICLKRPFLTRQEWVLSWNKMSTELSILFVRTKAKGLFTTVATFWKIAQTF